MKSCPKCSATYPDDYAVCPKDGVLLRDSSLWQINTVIRGKYKILARIGEGGMATVYKAHHQLLDEFRALKVIKPDLARDQQFAQRFKNEAIITRKLQHPNAVRVDDLDLAEDGRPFISMEFVEGESLKSLIQRTGPLGVPRSLDIGLQVCQALGAAHALGLIHRDIKPDNIFLVARAGCPPLVKVLDFGIARLKEDAPGGGRGMTLTGTGVVIGTPEYMSPEQAMGKHGDQLDARSDLYSLGVVMYRMLTGELPFQADTTMEMILHHIQTAPKAPQALKPNLAIPSEISALVMKAIEKDRDKRFASAADMAGTLQAVRARMSAPPQAGAAVRPAGPAPPAPVKAGSANLEPPRPLQPPPKTPPAQAQAATPAARPAPVRSAGPRPGPLIKPPRREFPTRVVVFGVVAMFLVLLGLAALKRHRTASQQAAAVPQPQPTGKTNLVAQPQPTPTQETPKPGAEARPAGREIRQMLQNAQVFFDTGDYPRAAKVSRRILDLDPNNSAAKQLFVKSSQKQAQRFYDAAEYRRAAMMFRLILDVDPNNPAAQESLKQCKLALQNRP